MFILDIDNRFSLISELARGLTLGFKTLTMLCKWTMRTSFVCHLWSHNSGSKTSSHSTSWIVCLWPNKHSHTYFQYSNYHQQISISNCSATSNIVIDYHCDQSSTYRINSICLRLGIYSIFLYINANKYSIKNIQ